MPAPEAVFVLLMPLNPVTWLVTASGAVTVIARSVLGVELQLYSAVTV